MIYLQLFWAFFKIGALGFGGGMAIIGMIYDTISPFVQMTATQYANIVAIAQVTPGPVAVNTATYVGYQCAGYFGAFIATLGVSVPAFIIIAVVASMVEKYKESVAVNGALAGIRPATVGLILAAAITIGEPAFFTKDTLGSGISALSGILPGNFDVLSLIMCVATIVLIRKFRVNTFLVLIIMGCIGAVLGV